MRFCAVLVAVGSLLGAAPYGRAESAPADAPATGEAKAPRSRAAAPPYRLVRVMPDTHQALLFDKKRGTHVLVDAGDAVGGFEVAEVGVDHVVLARAGDTREYVLVAGEATVTTRLADPYPIPDPAPAPGSPLLDPYPAGVLDPYGGDGVREVQAPKGQRASEAPPPPPAPVAKAPEPAAPADARTEITVSRARLDAALSDFARIEREVTMNLVSAGVALQRVAKGSFFHEMGLRDGDIVRKVDGTLIRSLDDAAIVYARLAKATRFQVDVQRGGKPVTLRYTITK